MRSSMLTAMLARVALASIVAALLVFVFVSQRGTAHAEPADAVVSPGQGVSFSQIDVLWLGATTLNSSTGQVDVDIATLTASTGISSGYINVSTGDGWVIQNLPIFPDFPYPSVSSKFELSTASSPGNIASLLAFVDFSASPVTSFAPDSGFSSFPVGDSQYDAEGFGGVVAGGPPEPPPPGGIVFSPGGLFRRCFQGGHPNVQAANMQCAPAALANSLDWLKIQYGIRIPHLNNLGQGCPPDQTLVGQLDVAMGRACVSRASGSATAGAAAFLTGKLCYLFHSGLGNALTVKHQGAGAAGNFSACGLTSIGNGAVLTANFIINEVCHGEDVELGFAYKGGGGHVVELVGAGTTLGVPWIQYKSDHLQAGSSDPMDKLGTGSTDFAYLVDTDNPPDGLLNLVGEPTTANATGVVAESPRNVGGAAELLASGGDSAWYAEGFGGSLSNAALAGALAAAVVALAAGGLYARRRWVRARR